MPPIDPSQVLTPTLAELEQCRRELDELIAIEIFGCRWLWSSVTSRRCLYGPGVKPSPWMTRPADGTEEIVGDCQDGMVLVPHYSTDIASAWLIVEEMGLRGYWLRLTSPFTSGQPWHAGFTPNGVTGWNGRPDLCGHGETAAIAICRAALAVAEQREGAE